MELNAKDLEAKDVFSGCAFHLRRFSPWVIGFNYEIGVAGKMLVLKPQADESDAAPIAISVWEGQRAHVPEGINRNARRVTSAEGLAQALGADFRKRTTYRDHVSNENFGREM